MARMKVLKNANHVEHKIINATRLTVPSPAQRQFAALSPSPAALRRAVSVPCSGFGRVSRAALDKRSVPVDQTQYKIF